MKLLIKVRRDARKFWDANTFIEQWTESWRGHYISRLGCAAEHKAFFSDFMMCPKEDFQRKLYHDYWNYKKIEYCKKYRKGAEQMIKKLKRCPFCGGEAELSIHKNFVCCSRGLDCPGFAVIAVEDWQTRPREDTLTAALQHIAEVCNKCASTDEKFAEIRLVIDKVLEMK